MNIEYAAKAIIIIDNHILLIRNKDNFGEWYCLPGGRQIFGETLEETLKRECFEEVGIEIKSFNLAFIREYIHKNHKFRDLGINMHKVEFMYLCESNASIFIAAIGNKPDKNHQETKWVEIGDLPKLRIFPTRLKKLKNMLNSNGPQYWGDEL